MSDLDSRIDALPVRSLSLICVVWLVSACSAGGGVCADYAVYGQARPAVRLSMPDGMTVNGRDGSTEVPGVGPDYQPVVQTTCMSAPPMPDPSMFLEDSAESAESAGPTSVGSPVMPTEPADVELGGSDAVLVTVYTWASLWAAGDLDGYRELYAASFVPPRGADQATWDRITANRVRASGPRTVDVYSPVVRLMAPDRAEVRFRVQERRAGGASTELQVRMLLIVEQGVWRIAEEDAGPG